MPLAPLRAVAGAAPARRSAATAETIATRPLRLLFVAGRSRVPALLRLDDEAARRSRAPRDGRGQRAAGAQARAARDLMGDERIALLGEVPAAAAIGGCRWRAPCAGRSTSCGISIRGLPTLRRCGTGCTGRCCRRLLRPLDRIHSLSESVAAPRLMRFLQASERAIPVSPVIRRVRRSAAARRGHRVAARSMRRRTRWTSRVPRRRPAFRSWRRSPAGTT